MASVIAGGKKHVLIITALLACVCIIYANSIGGEWHFDDVDIILHDANVHTTGLSWPELKKTFYWHGHLYRPLARLSFGLNHYFGGLDVRGYHIINIVVHCITTVFLFLFIAHTLRLSGVKEQIGGEDPALIAGLATLLWAVNPVQVLAISYIVQRMASMAGMFYIMAMYCYVMGRTDNQPRKAAGFFLVSFIAFVLACGSKENAYMLPVSIAVYDLLLIQGAKAAHIKRILKVLIPITIIAIGLWAWYTDFSTLLNGYRTRPFTLTERLLTEPRVILHYALLLLYPVSSRLTFLHDIEISRSLFIPWTTLPALMLIASLLIFACMTARKRPLISFSIIFFFLNHVIESSFIPLELMYEHRVYLPSFFFFIPPVLLLARCYRYFASRRIIRILMIFVAVVVIAAQGHTVFMRNQILNCELTLWLDNVEKSPNLSLPHNNLGRLYRHYGLLTHAYREFETALRLNNFQNIRSRAVVEYNMGELWLTAGNNDKAMSFFTQALRTNPGYADPLIGIAIVKLRENAPAYALEYIEKALKAEPENAEFHEYAGIALLKLGLHDAAGTHAHQSLELQSERILPLAVLAEIHRARGQKKMVRDYWEAFKNKKPTSITAHFTLIELYGEAEDIKRRHDVIDSLLSFHHNQEIKDLIRRSSFEIEALVHVADAETVISAVRSTRQAYKGK
jgi:tetratricopeptide (TPR) repeat protein